MSTLLHLNPEALPRTISWDCPLSDDEFEALCLENDNVRLERSKEGKVIMTPLTGDDTGRANAEIARQLGNWWHTHLRGAVYDSSTGFYLPDGSNFSPDAAYVLPEKLGPREGRGRKMAHRCPDFVIELLSSSDRLRDAKAKMNDWVANGAALAWLIDPYQRQVTIYTAGQAPQVTSTDSIEGSGPIEGFTLNLAEIWRLYES
jgi:Uma2 family endonuclease